MCCAKGERLKAKGRGIARVYNKTSVYYIDIINELEHMGDYMINISQSLERAFVEE